MGILEEDIERVRSEVPILDVIGRHVEVKRVGASYKSLCPFHAEKSPSFSISPDKGMYFCFGCGAKGDVITFLREIEGYDFPTAVEALASSIGVVVRHDDADKGEERERRAQLVGVMERAVEFFAANLAKAPTVLDYLKGRGITDDEIATYRIGWALSSKDALQRHFKGVEATILADCGLVFLAEDRVVDHFRDRVMFPIFNPQGEPIAFGGRLLPGADGRGPKYKNSPEGRLYKKSRVLYGLNWAKQFAVKSDEIVVCEGYTDVIGLARCGAANAVATCGTALTEEHARLLRRFASRVVLVFDPDAAGASATDHFFQWEQELGLEVVVAILPQDMDPGDLAQRDPALLAKAVSAARPLLEDGVDRLIERSDRSTIEHRVKVAHAALDLVDRHPSQVIRAEYLNTVAARLSLDATALRSDRARRVQPPAPPRPQRIVAEAPARAALGVETEALRVLIHTPEDIAHALEPWMFTDPIVMRGWTLLSEYSLVATAAAQADEATARLLHELVAIPGPVSSGRRAYARLLEAAADRHLVELREAALATASTPDLTLMADIGRLQVGIDKLRSEAVTDEVLVDMAVRLRAAAESRAVPAPESDGGASPYEGFDPEAGW